MKYERFNFLVDDLIKTCTDTLELDMSEYSNNKKDCLITYRKAAELIETNAVQALGAMASKQLIEIFEMINKFEQNPVDVNKWTEKLKCTINYLLILSALVHDSVDEVTIVFQKENKIDDL